MTTAVANAKRQQQHHEVRNMHGQASRIGQQGRRRGTDLSVRPARSSCRARAGLASFLRLIRNPSLKSAADVLRNTPSASQQRVHQHIQVLVTVVSRVRVALIVRVILDGRPGLSKEAKPTMQQCNNARVQQATSNKKQETSNNATSNSRHATAAQQQPQGGVRFPSEKKKRE